LHVTVTEEVKVLFGQTAATLGISQRLVMSATIKLYELAGAGRVVIPSAGDRRSIVTWRDRLLMLSVGSPPNNGILLLV